MDLISALKNELFRPLATVIAPGSIAATPWLMVFFSNNPSAINFFINNHAAGAFAFIIVTTVTGFILENIGARIESKWDKCINKDHSKKNSTWNSYLQLKTNDEIIGQRYLRTIVTRLKFELSIVPAILIACAGLIMLNYFQHIWTKSGLFTVVLPALFVAFYLLYESYSSVKLCADIRDQILISANKSTY